MSSQAARLYPQSGTTELLDAATETIRRRHTSLTVNFVAFSFLSPISHMLSSCL